MHYCIAVLSETGKETDVKKLLAPYRINPENNNGKWDYYDIGGRFDDVLIKNNQYYSSARLKDINLEDFYTYGILTPDGKWYDAENFDKYKNWSKLVLSGQISKEENKKMLEEIDEEWRNKFKEILESADPEWIVTIVDAHI